MLASIVLTTAFSPQAPLSAHQAVAMPRMASAPVSMNLMDSRRAALVKGASLAALVSMPMIAVADENEDAVMAIARKTMEKNEAEKAKKAAAVAKKAAKMQGKSSDRENEGSDVLVKGGLAASFFLSLPFFYKNLARLGLSACARNT